MHRHSYEKTSYTPSGSDRSSSDSSRDGSDINSGRRSGDKGKKGFNAYGETRESGSAMSLERKKAGITKDMDKLETEQIRLNNRAAELIGRAESAINNSIDSKLDDSGQKALGVRAQEYEKARDQHNTFVKQYNSSLAHLKSRMTAFNVDTHKHNKNLKDQNNRVKRIEESLDKVDKLKSFNKMWEDANKRKKEIFDERTRSGKGNYDNYDDGSGNGGGSAYDQYKQGGYDGGYGGGFGSGFNESDYL